MSFVSHANDENKMEGTYQGVDDDENFVFTKTDGTKVIFHAIDDAVEISLYDDDEIGKKFKIEWMAEEWDDYDDNDNVVGTITVKKITALTRM